MRRTTPPSSVPRTWRPWRRFFGAGTVAGIAALAAIASSSSAATGTAAASGSGTFVVDSDNVGVSLDPALASDQPGFQAVTPVYQSLVDDNPTTDKLEPSLATSWSVAGSGKTITLHLRKGVKFHDGSALSAAGVVISLDRTVAINKGESFLISDMKKAVAAGPLTLKIDLKAPDSDFLYSLTRIYIVSGQAAKEHAGSDNGQSWFASHEAGSGAYTVTSWQPNNHLTLTEFPGYWGGWSGKHVKTFQFKEVPDSNTQLLDVEKGNAEFANAVSITNAVKARSNKNVQVLMGPGSPFYLMFDTNRAPLNNVNVRHALSLAVPYSEIIKQIMYGTATKMNGPVPSWMTGADKSLAAPSENITEAKKLLAKAGYGASKPLTLTFAYFPGWTFEQSIAAAYQYELAKIGVQLKISALPWATFTQEISKPSTRPDIGTIAVYVPIPSPGPTLTYSFDPASEGNWAYWGYNNPTVTSLISKAETSTSSAGRISDYQKAEQSITGDYAAAWLMQIPDVFVLSPKVHGVQNDATLGQVLNCYGVWLS
jgi:peptide/nickel transport system substrate-binding protein